LLKRQFIYTSLILLKGYDIVVKMSFNSLVIAKGLKFALVIVRFQGRKLGSRIHLSALA